MLAIKLKNAYFKTVIQCIIDNVCFSLMTNHNRRRLISGREPCRTAGGRGEGGLKNVYLYINDYERVLFNRLFGINDTPDKMDFVWVYA